MACGYSIDEANQKIKYVNKTHNAKYYCFTKYTQFIEFAKTYYILKNVNYDNKEYLLDFFNFIKDKKHNTTELKNIVLSYIKKNRTKRGTTSSIEYWVSLGYNENESIELVKKHQKKASKLSVEYWINHGYTEEDAKKEISKLQKKNNTKKLK